MPALSDLDPIFQAAGQEWNVDPALLKSVATVETGGQADPNNASSRTGAQGLMQIQPSTQQLLGITNPADPVQSIYGAAKYLSQGLDAEGTPEGALLYYHGGPQWRQAYGTQSAAYVPKVIAAYQAHTAASGNDAPAADAPAEAAAAPAQAVQAPAPQPAMDATDAFLSGATPAPAPGAAPAAAPAAMDATDRFLSAADAPPPAPAASDPAPTLIDKYAPELVHLGEGVVQGGKDVAETLANAGSWLDRKFPALAALDQKTGLDPNALSSGLAAERHDYETSDAGQTAWAKGGRLIGNALVTTPVLGPEAKLLEAGASLVPNVAAPIVGKNLLTQAGGYLARQAAVGAGTGASYGAMTAGGTDTPVGQYVADNAKTGALLNTTLAPAIAGVRGGINYLRGSYNRLIGADIAPEVQAQVAAAQARATGTPEAPAAPTATPNLLTQSQAPQAPAPQPEAARSAAGVPAPAPAASAPPSAPAKNLLVPADGESDSTAAAFKDGWYVHGRASDKEAATAPWLQLTKNMDVASQYAGDQGNAGIWFMRPKAGAITLDLSSPDSPDMEKVVAKALRDYNAGSLPFDSDINGQLEDVPDEHVEAAVRDNFAPKNIVNSAQAFDNDKWINWLYDRFSPDFVKTPDGAVSFGHHPDSGAVEMKQAVDDHLGNPVFPAGPNRLAPPAAADRILPPPSAPDTPPAPTPAPGAPGVPNSVGAAATTASDLDSGDMTNRQLIAARIAQLDRARMSGPNTRADSTEYVSGSVPTMAERFADPVLAGWQKVFSQGDPDAVAWDNLNNERRQIHLEDIRGHASSTLNAREAAEAQYDAGKTAALTNSSPIPQDAMQAVHDQIQSIVSDPENIENDAVQKHIAPLLGRLKNPDGTFKSDPAQMLGLRKTVNYNMSKGAQSDDNSLSQVGGLLGKVKGSLDSAIESGAPGMKQVNADYSAAMRPVEAQDYLQGLDYSRSGGMITLPQSQGALKSIRNGLASPNDYHPAKSLTDDDLQGLIDLHQDLLRQSNRDIGKPRGSDTNYLTGLTEQAKGAGANMLARAALARIPGGGAAAEGLSLVNNLSEAANAARTKDLWKQAIFDRSHPMDPR